MKKIYLSLCYGVLLTFGCNTQAGQIVSPAAAHPFIAAGDMVDVELRYQVSSPETSTEAGLGLRIHYNSDLLTPQSISLLPDALQPYGDTTEDTQDFDNDPQTDRYFIVSWIDFDAQWPGANLPLTLAELQLTVLNNLSTPTQIGFSASATAKNTTFQATPLTLCPKPVVTVSADPASVSESGLSPDAGFLFQADQIIAPGCGDLVLSYGVGGNATAGDDYLPLSGSITIPAGQSSAELMVDLIDDDLVEADETLEVTLRTSPDYQSGSASAAVLNIQSEDQTSVLPEVNLSVGKLTVTEGQSGSLLLFAERTAASLSQPLEVLLELGGTVTADDYHAFPDSIIIPAGSDKAFAVLLLKDDGEQEADETLYINIVATEYYQRGENSSLQLTIQDDELNQNTSLPTTTTGTTQAAQSAATLRSTHQIPTVSEWLLILMSLLLGGMATLHLRISDKGVTR